MHQFGISSTTNNNMCKYTAEAEKKKINQNGRVDYPAGTIQQHPKWVEESQKPGLEVSDVTEDKDDDMKYLIEIEWIILQHIIRNV